MKWKITKITDVSYESGYAQLNTTWISLSFRWSACIAESKPKVINVSYGSEYIQLKEAELIKVRRSVCIAGTCQSRGSTLVRNQILNAWVRNEKNSFIYSFDRLQLACRSLQQRRMVVRETYRRKNGAVRGRIYAGEWRGPCGHWGNQWKAESAPR